MAQRRGREKERIDRRPEEEAEVGRVRIGPAVDEGLRGEDVGPRVAEARGVGAGREDRGQPQREGEAEDREAGAPPEGGDARERF